MPSRKRQYTTITFFFYFALVLSLASFVNASTHLNANHKRLLKKRSPQILKPPSDSDQTSLSTTALTETRGSASSTIQASSSSVQSSTVLVSPTLSSLTPSVSSTSSSTSLSSSSGSPSVTSSVATSSTSSSVATVTESATSMNTLPSSTMSRSTLTQTETLAAASPSVTPEAQGASSKTGRTTFMVIIIIASVAGGVTILWTIFRKWKLARSSKFDERLQPIDWQPTPENEGRHRPTSNASSFHSGTHGTVTGHGGYGTSSDHGHGHSDHGHANGLAPLPDHDFTPISSNLAPVGGYADLARGPSPQPQMHETYMHGPIFNRPAYDINVPLHHQAGYGTRDVYDYNAAPMRY